MRKLISHRGNTNGPEPVFENRPDFIQKALAAGFDVELEVWFIENQWYLGHDEPEYITTESFLKTKGLWCHAKNIEAFEKLLELGVICFWHENDKYTLTSNGYVWTYPGNQLTPMSISVMPEKYAAGTQDLSFCAGICTDYPLKYAED